MKLKTYLEKLNKLVEDKPEVLDWTVIAAGDDEGNYFNEVIYDPTICKFDSATSECEIDIEDPDNNAVCLN